MSGLSNSLVFAAAVLLIPAAADDVDSGHSIYGSWNVVEIWQDGKRLDGAKVLNSTWTFTKNRVTVRYTPFKERPPLDIGIKCHINEKEQQYDILLHTWGCRRSNGPLGIYSINGDTLRMCAHPVDRPREYQTAPDDERTLLVLKRATQTPDGN